MYLPGGNSDVIELGADALDAGIGMESWNLTLPVASAKTAQGLTHQFLIPIPVLSQLL